MSAVGLSALSVNVALSAVAFGLTVSLISSLKQTFINAGQFGHDISKPDRPQM